MMTEMKGITGTVVFESSALNRDQSVGNITTLKKLSIGSDLFAFLSRPWITHKLFSTLTEIYPESWKPGELTSSKGVIQHRLIDVQDRELRVFQDIVRSAELDAFGYMSTAAKQKKKKGTDGQQEESDTEKPSSSTLSRKAAVSLTKAIALYPWRGDMAFYANHSFVNRANSSQTRASGTVETPNPYSREEDYNLFKYSFTIDLTRLGRDVWILDSATLKSLSGKLRDLEEEVSDAGGKVTLDDKTGSLVFELSKEKRKERVMQILNVIKNGLLAQCAGENYGIVPAFMAVAALKTAIPLFHSDIYFDKASGKLSFSSILETIRENGYILRDDGKPLALLAGKESLHGMSERVGMESWEAMCSSIEGRI